MIDINEFDAIRIGLASSKQIRDWSSGEVTKPETINYRTLKPERDGLFCERIFGPTKDWECYCGKYKRVRYKGIICERCGVEVTRQKVRRERMGHIDLAAPVSHIWFFKGVPSRIGYLLDIAPRELEKVLYFAASIVTAVDNEKRAADLADLEDKVRAESEQIYVDRDEQLAAIEDRLARRRDYFASGKERNFDEDDEFWARGLNNWAEDQMLPTLEETRALAGGIFPQLAKTLSTEDGKKIRELVRQTATREDRKLSPREIESVATAAQEIHEALDPLRAELETATGSKKGAITKHLHRLIDALTSGAELAGEDAALVASVDAKNLDKAREVGNGLLADVLAQAQAGQSAEEVRELAYDLCLLPGARKDDLDVVGQWALKVREMVQDMDSRRDDSREAAVEGVRRLEETWKLFRELEPKLVVNDEQLFRELKDRFGSPYGFGQYFRGGMGAEAIRDLLRDLDLVEESRALRETIKTSKGQKQQRAIKRLKVVEAFIKSENKPEWMILEAVPVIPPELRPMVQLDGGRFATSDLNDLYRRVINRNNRLKRLLDLGAPEIIVNNEKRMLQEAVDALFDNGRRGRAVTGPGNRPLKSLSDMLKGKQGRFRQNLLGKRVDYSGRSVIVAGPNLKLHQCGLPKLMALELFKPFIMSRLVERKAVQNIKAAKKHVESMSPDVWDVLEEVIAEHPVLLNRAPTLHRLGIQAFEPILVEGKAIQVHPLVCHAFNADFDGDQMAVHLPLSAEAQAEARILMLSANNILSPAHGRPLATPTQEMVLGSYVLTYCEHDLAASTAAEIAKKLGKDGLKRFRGEDEVQFAVEAGQIRLQEPIEFRWQGELVLTTPGRAIFNIEIQRSLQAAVHRGGAEGHRFINRALSKRDLDAFIAELVNSYGAHTVATVLDTIKALAFRYATQAGITVSKNDVVIPPEKEAILAQYEAEVGKVEREYERGLMTEDERHERIVAIWTEATDRVADAMKETLHETNPIFMMANSGARGSFNQIRQLAGMRGLMANPKGEIIERPIKANFMEGLSVLEYFISTHGARKGLADTALRTADSGYLTRRLVDVSQDVIIRDLDCGTSDYVELPAMLDGQLNRSVAGRVLAVDVHKPLKDGKPGKTVLAAAGTELTLPLLQELLAGLEEHAEGYHVPVRSVLKCRSELGVCRACYGTFLATGDICEVGDAVGIIAAQSIGEPGTQLTMRTFHTGGVAGADITHGLPRVVEIFEARNPKGAATLAEVAGKVEIEEADRTIKVSVVPSSLDENGEPIPAKEYSFPRRTRFLVGNGQLVEAGDPLNEGSIAPAELLALKGSTATELYLVGEVQKVYKSQGVDIHDKHIELIVRQMLKKVRVESAGDTALLPGQLVDKVVLGRANEDAAKAKKERASFEPLILGITKASLATESFLSAASFQETTKVLTDAAIEGKIDRLLGLKENVIIGKLIPAATGLKKYRNIEIEPAEPLPSSMFAAEAQELLAALEEIGDVDIDLTSLGLGFDEDIPVEDAPPEPTEET
ncbi:DNA-directed RNA polymerase subunit beta [Gaiella occulta]|uniref:DNA-directed RNA polymerase subunit beta' n=2 Tax=Gaiella TaxID=1154586 RepID=A0A7M2YWY3_9ACTN|nr:DNA-directed RNA polymerase subunit beta' [Gaiella occulta]RDI74633.1 DNA-directed RNA polymerase subunit beta [Gaiella occulta]